MYHPYLSEQLSGEKETEFQSRADEARQTRKTGRRISGLVAAVVVLGMLAGACGAGPVADDDGVTSRQVVTGAAREAMLKEALAELIRINGPYTQQGSAVEASLVPAGLIGINGPYAARSQEVASLVPAGLIELNGPYTEAENTAEVPANVR